MANDDLNMGLEPGADMEMPESVDMLREESAEDDALQAPESTLDEFADNEEGNDEQEAEPAPPGQKAAPGWINKRIQTGVQKGIKREMDSIMAQFSAKLDAGIKAATAPLQAELLSYRTSAIEREAQALVASGEVKNLDIAKAYVSQKYGASNPPGATPAPTDAPPAKAPPKSVDARTDILAKQAVKLKASGFDVFSVYQGNQAVKAKVDSGDWDMHDVAEYMQRAQKAGRPPVPVRSVNGGSVPKISPMKMSDDQMDKLDEALAQGKVYRGSRG